MSDPAQRTGLRGRVLLFLVVSLGAAILCGQALAGFFVELLWHRSVGFGPVFWTRTLAEGGMRILAGSAVAALTFGNLRMVARTLEGFQIRRRFGNLEIAERIPRRTVTLGILLASLALGLWLGASFPRGAGLRALLLLRAPLWGVEVPPVGVDLSFFVFTLPFLEGVLVFGLALTLILFSLAAGGYAATGALVLRGGQVRVDAVPGRHLALLGGAFLLILACRFWLAQYLLLLDGSSGVQGIFGFADAQARIPGYRAVSLLTAGGVLAVAWAGFRRRRGVLLGTGAGLLVGWLVLVQLYPRVVQRFQVEPNELARETPFIEANLEFTRRAFGLLELRRASYPYVRGEAVDWEEAARQFAGLPVWTPDALLTTFRQVEARFRYYDFPTLAMDRYPSPAGSQPVAVAVREIDPAGIEDPNWQNLHLRTRLLEGMGAVASPLNRRSPEGRPEMYLSGIPPSFTTDPRAPPGLRLIEPAVYFGSRPQLHAVLEPAGEEEGGGSTPRGILLSSPLRTLALAWRFRDPNLLFSSEVSSGSRFLFRRQVAERALAVAPFLRFLDSPYPVILEGRILWILEGYTTSRTFPLAARQALPGGRRASYVRHSVTVTVDALSGETRFFRLAGEDPLLEAWSRVFPGLFLPLEEMPEGVRAHLRYPKELLNLQARVLLQYHQETAPRFHGQQDVWALPQELSLGARPAPYLPEYGIYRLPGEEHPEFLLSTVFVPAGRQNLTALLVARCDPLHHGELLLFDIPVEDQVPGPRQVEALVEQDPVISQRLSLWRQSGSRIWSGHLHVVPVGGTLLYLEGIFLAAEADAIPELRRFVVSDGRRVAMEPSLEEAMAALAPAGAWEWAAPAPLPFPEGASPDPGEWPREALELLEAAEERLRAGDWGGFGSALEALRSLLRRAAQGGEGG